MGTLADRAALLPTVEVFGLSADLDHTADCTGAAERVPDVANSPCACPDALAVRSRSAS